MKFEELNAEQQAKAIEQHRHINVYSGWDDFLEDDFKEKMNTFGFSDIDISSDTSFCQGSGASFTCNDIDLIKYLTTSKQLSKYRKLKQWIKDGDLTASIKRTSHSYNHSNTIDISLDVLYSINVTPEQSDLLGEFKTDIIEFVRSECNAFHRELEKEYLTLISDDEVKDNIIANELDFAIKDPNVNYL